MNLLTQDPQPTFRIITLTRCQCAIVDAEDYEFLSQWNWQACWDSHIKGFYARRRGGIAMHREVMKAPKHLWVDHRDHNTLDNRKKNLRLANPRQSRYNQRMRSNNTSGYKGVSWFKPTGRWWAHIGVGGKSKSLGLYDTREEAFEAYCKAARNMHDEDFIYLIP